MTRSYDETNPIWGENRLAFPLAHLTENTVTDVCVVGAGIAGLTAAYLLAKEGRNVVVLEAFDLAAGETGRTTAHLTCVLDDRCHEMAAAFGEDDTQVIVESHLAAITRIESIIREEGIDCDFERCDGYLAAGSSELVSELEKEADACLKAGIADRTVHSVVPLEGIALQGPVLRLPQQAMFHPVKYMTGLAEAFISRGGRIFTGARVVGVRDEMPVVVVTENGHEVHASAAIIATHTPVNDLVTMHTKQAAYRSYAIACEVPRHSFPPFLLWDMLEPYHYVRLMRGPRSDYLIVGGEDHKTGQANDADSRYAALEAWTRRHFAQAGAVAHKWSGQVLEPVDRLAFIGLNPGDKNIYIATGFSGNGMTYGTIAGILIRDLIEKRDNMWARIYDPARRSMSAMTEFVRENANVVACMVGDWASQGEVSNLEDVPPGQGALVRDGLSKLAAYRDEQGEMHVCSAVCTHLNCIVQWNAGEKSWDCPCHGSRFDTDGKVLNGPAIKSLAPSNREEAGLGAPVTEAPMGGAFPNGPVTTGKNA